jgi:hypothetical protein
MFSRLHELIRTDLTRDMMRLKESKYQAGDLLSCGGAIITRRSG